MAIEESRQTIYRTDKQFSQNREDFSFFAIDYSTLTCFNIERRLMNNSIFCDISFRQENVLLHHQQLESTNTFQFLRQSCLFFQQEQLVFLMKSHH